MKFLADDGLIVHNRTEYATLKKAADLAGVRYETVRAWTVDQGLKTYAVRPGRTKWVRVDELQQVAQQQRRARGVALTAEEISTAMRGDLTAREAAILTGRTVGAVRQIRAHRHNPAAAA